MPTHPTSSDAPSWRRATQSTSASHPMPAPAHRDQHAQRKPNDKPHDNWRLHAHPVSDSSRQPPPSHAQPLAISTPHNRPSRAVGPNDNAPDTKPSLLSSSFKREQPKGLSADWVPGQHPHPDPHSAHAIKPSGIGNGIIGRAPELGTSPTNLKGPAVPAARHHWPLSSSLEKNHQTGPATNLHPLRIEPTERSRFFPSASTPLKSNQVGQHPLRHQQPQLDKNRDDNWMLTPTSSLPSIPSTPNRVRESSTERLLAGDDHAEAQLSVNGRPTPSIRGPVEHLQASLHTTLRTPSPGFGSARQQGSSTSTSLFNRGLSVNVQASPKRSPLGASTHSQRQQSSTITGNSVLLSPVSSPRLAHRTLSPMTRHPPAIPEAHTSGDRVVTSIASMLSGASPQPRPGSVSRRESFNSVTSAGATHSLSHSRRSSAVLSPNSPALSNRIGVYRPPHLRNRDSVSGLKPSVAHYDRVRTPSLRGLSRSRESSVSLSRPTSRPPSTVPFYPNESIPEDGQAGDPVRTPLRGRQSSTSIHLPDLIADQQLRNAAAAAAATGPDSGQAEPFAANTTHLLEQPLDSASLLAKLRAQLVRREAAASDVAASDFDRTSIAADENEQEFFDLSEMMEYGASEGHLLSRHASAFVMEGRPPGDVFEIGDLLGPGLEHDGHIIQIAETTPGFVEQNADLTGSKLEVVRKLGEGSYAAVYLVKEVSAEEAASHISQKSVSIPSSASRPGLAETASKDANDDADLTMVASSDDLLSSTLKADGTGKGEGFHNSPALEERRRKDLKVDTTLRPGKEFALKCLCKRDLPEDMLEVQRLEATIHQSIPTHPNIVTLYRTYETPDWLFLVLEYCPGQDLYYWLEQAQDAGRPTFGDEDASEKMVVGQDDADAKPNGASTVFEDDNYEVLGSSLDATPPSPSILASTSGHGLLSKRRIRLIARMFRQICDAVQFCHDRGVSHRDLKPENFIVEDRRTVEEMQSACPDTSVSTLVDSTRDGDETQVIVKMTDFGLATADDRCDDFDCGSKPYMAFECANNVSSSYDPKQADIWSLGVVLLNLLFHRSPFTEPSMNCASFAAYCEDPIRFLMESFDGLTETVARFLSENVFCSVTDSDDVSQKRISAGEFSRWACGLVEHMGLSGSGPGRVSRGASVYATIPLMHSRTGSMSTLPSILSSPRPRARSLARDTDQILDLDATADGTFRAAFADAAAERHRSLSPYPGVFTPDVLPSPTFTPLPHPSERNPFDLQYATIEEAVGGSTHADRHEQNGQVDRLDLKVIHSPNGMPNGNVVESHGIASGRVSPLTDASNMGFQGNAASGGSDAAANGAVGTEDATRSDDAYPEAKPEADDQLAGKDGDATGNGEAGHVDTVAGDAKEGAEDGDQSESITTSNHSKRRKRGARKGRTLAKQLKRSQSTEAMADADANDPAAKARQRERTIRELAQASESLARQMSKMTKPSDVTDGLTPPQITLSRPTAEAAARYSLQGLAEADAESAQVASSTGLPAARNTKAMDDVAGAASTPAANWNSAAARRDRMSEQRKTGTALLGDADRSRVMSWRDRNQSAATLSSLTSSVTTVSSHSSLTSATSSIYSTASAPAALTRKDFSGRNRTRGSAFGLDTISEREKAAPTKKEVDAKYLAAIFGGGDGQSRDKPRKELPTTRPGDGSRAKSNASAVEVADAPAIVPTKLEKSDKGSKFFGLLSDGSGSKVNNATTSTEMETQAAEPSRRVPGETSAVHGASQRSVSVGSTASTTSNSGVAASFVSRFRRPTSSSTTSAAPANKTAPASEPEGDAASGTNTSSFLGASLGMRRDASTSTSSLHRVKEDGSDPARAVAPTVSNGSGGNKTTTTDDAVPADATAAAKAPKKRGMGKFLLGVRDSIKNF